MFICALVDLKYTIFESYLNKYKYDLWLYPGKYGSSNSRKSEI